ncbi:Xylose isomerase domain-containing protein TIM barrel [Planctomycetales bacterium 10988]|nr:Xylose isomerase domain-containing protein TIM barrel [Planctomycetales bacterium 10988]
MLKVATKFLPELSAFDLAYQAGFRSAEFWLDTNLISQWESLSAMANYYPLNYALHFPNRATMEQGDLENTVAFYQAIEAQAVVIHQPMFDRYSELLTDLDADIPLAVENHRLNEAEFEQWAQANPGLTLDVEHLWKFTLQDAPLEVLLEKVQTFLERYHEKLLHVHLPGYQPGYAEHRPMYRSEEMVFPVLSLFSEFEMQGLIVSEIHQDYQNLNDLQMDVLLFNRWRKEHDPRYPARNPTIPAVDGQPV